MENYSVLKGLLDRLIYTNTKRSITGNILNGVLKDLIGDLGAGYQYLGKAFPDTDPGQPDYRVVYLASAAGVYVNFGGISISEFEVALLKYNGTWEKEIIVDTSGAELKTNKVTNITEQSTNDEYPSALSVYRLFSNIATPFGYEVVETLPTPSAYTMGIIYLVSDGSDTAFYITNEDSGIYTWKPIGILDTSITAITQEDIDSLFD